MSRLEKAARATYGRHLEGSETIAATVDGFAGNAGRPVLYATAAGALCGALAWTLLDKGGLLPLVVLGMLTGIIFGVAAAARQARNSKGPGALIVKLVLTNSRLLLLRGRAAVRLKPVRSIPLDETAGLVATPATVGDYQHLYINLAGRPAIHLLVSDGEAVATLIEEYGIATLPPSPASQETPNG